MLNPNFSNLNLYSSENKATKKLISILKHVAKSAIQKVRREF